MTALAVAMASLAVFGLVMSRSSENRRIDDSLAADAKEHGGLLDRTLELEGGSLAVFASDYSYWDEMVQFVETRDLTWATVNLDEALTTYKAGAAWVFDAAESLLYVVRDSTLEGLDRPVPQGLTVRDALGDDRVGHFFIAGPDGPVEIRGATIHPSDDPERKTPVRGYLLVARSWGRQYLAGLTELTGKTMGIESGTAGAKTSAEIAPSSGEIKFIRPLPGPQGSPEIALAATLRPGWIAMARRSGRGQFTRSASLALLAVLGLTFVLWLWVTRPLGRIRRSLEFGSAEALKPLERSRSEFGQLAQLVGQFFGQNAALVKEVTERRRAEVELAAQAERASVLFEHSPDGCYLSDLQGTFLDGNRAAEQLLGYRREELIGASFLKLNVLPASELPRAAGLLVRNALGQATGPDELVLRRKDGALVTAEICTHVITIHGRKVVLGSARDISARKRAEQAQRESEEKFKRLFEESPSGIALVDAEGVVREANPRLLKLLGIRRGDLVGRPFRQLLPGFGLDLHEQDGDFRTRLAGEPAAKEIAFRNQGGGQTTLAVQSSVIESEGRTAGVLFLVNDITERKQAETALALKNVELAGLNEQKNQFLGMAAHDLRNPLAVIMARSEFVLDGLGGTLTPEQTTFIAAVKRSSEFMLKLVNDLLDVAKIESGKVNLELEPTDLAELLTRNIALNRMLAGKKGIRLELELASGLPTMELDPSKIEQVLNNLVSNAVKFSNPGSAVNIRATRVNGTVSVSVADSGPGIAPEETDKLFKPFGRASVRSQNGEKDTGLGLVIVKRIVEAHHGTIEVESEVGKGTTFVVTLPVGDASKGQSARAG